MAQKKQKRSAAEISEWLLSWLTKELSISRSELSVDEEFVNLGLESRTLVVLVGELEDWLGRPVDPSLAWEHPTIARLAAHLAD